MLKHIVYKITLIGENLPTAYMYVGSKTNCYIDEHGKIRDKNHRVYIGSTKDLLYNKHIKEGGDYKVEVLESVNDFKEMIRLEYKHQKNLNVVESIYYVNRSYCVVNTFTSPSYGVYKSADGDDKIVRLRTDDVLVTTGVFVGVTKGNKLTTEHKNKIGKSGKDNPFYGKTHTPEVKKILSEANKGRKLSHAHIEKLKESNRKQKTEEHKNKISESNKGYLVIKNIKTFESIRVKKSDYDMYYDKSLWYTANNKFFVKPKTIECEYCKKVSNIGNYKRWHSTNCKEFKKI